MMRWITFVVSLALSASVSGDQPKNSAAELLDLWRGAVCGVDRPEFQQLLPELRKAGFVESSQYIWRKSDANGELVILTPLPGQSAATLFYYPAEPAPFGDAALAALITKAPSIELGQGDSIVISLPEQNVNSGLPCTIQTYLEFSLRGGHWQRTSVYVSWKK
jgi:thiamine monophosphate kinase